MKHKTVLDWASDHWFLTFLIVSSAVGAVGSAVGTVARGGQPAGPYDYAPQPKPGAGPMPTVGFAEMGINRARY